MKRTDEYTCYHIAHWHWNVGRHAATKTQLKSRQQSYTKGRKPREIVNVEGAGEEQR